MKYSKLIRQVYFLTGYSTYYIRAFDCTTISLDNKPSWIIEYEGEEIVYEFHTTDKTILGTNYYGMDTLESLEFLKTTKKMYPEKHK